MSPAPSSEPGNTSGAARPGRLLAFVALAYLLSWSWWVPMALTGVVDQPGQGWPTHLPGLMGPAIAAFLVTAVTDGRAGVAELWSRVIRWRVGWIWYGIVAVTALLVLLPVATGTAASPDSYLTYSGAPLAGVSVVLYVLIVNGFGEEIGWRGFLAEDLLRRRSRAVTALIVWVIWAAWHLPLFWVVGTFRDFGVAGTIGWIVGDRFRLGVPQLALPVRQPLDLDRRAVAHHLQLHHRDPSRHRHSRGHLQHHRDHRRRSHPLPAKLVAPTYTHAIATHHLTVPQHPAGPAREANSCGGDTTREAPQNAG